MISVDINLLFAIINIIVLFLLLRKFLIKPVRNIMEKRDEMIRSGLENARKSQSDAELMKQEYEEKLKNAGDISAGIISDAKKEAEARSKNILDEANAKADNILSSARENAETAKIKAVSEAKEQIADLAAEMARKLVTTSKDSNFDSGEYDRFIRETGDDNDGN
ncbi:F0F1 ATP synthase subunit B [Gallibacter intestinalis]|jgi:F-type H+-transporting ATPase subunit b|uniref:ATP synthase subunit b n=1 Tax=Gallibacter intestinalis TaxID=2779356 RepID=A0ABR9R017_9FIRM|nr:F0F1 ATP synthase subunit B [Gallibacter intestinalis]MBE5036160.1 F0F1 ATP synthase subunit B [Gallibacter intestinalis]